MTSRRVALVLLVLAAPLAVLPWGYDHREPDCPDCLNQPATPDELALIETLRTEAGT